MSIKTPRLDPDLAHLSHAFLFEEKDVKNWSVLGLVAVAKWDPLTGLLSSPIY